jgi:uncharacterized protein YjbI with pentapeptide repeats
VRVTFKGVDFSIALGDGIDFSGFDFGDAADFSSCTWADIVGTTGRARFSGATFGDGATFVGTTFGNHADFSGATFGNRADFSGATFGDWVTFVTMHIEAWFFARKWYLVWPAVGETTDPMSDVALEFQADFSGATFGFEANFASAIFHIPTGFTGATFGDRASFKGTVFKGPVTFTGKSTEESIRRLEVDEHGIRNASGVALAGRHDALWRGLGSGPNCFVAFPSSVRASTKKPISPAAPSRVTPILPRRVFTARRISMPKPSLPGLI